MFLSSASFQFSLCVFHADGCILQEKHSRHKKSAQTWSVHTQKQGVNWINGLEKCSLLTEGQRFNWQTWRSCSVTWEETVSVQLLVFASKTTTLLRVPVPGPQSRLLFQLIKLPPSSRFLGNLFFFVFFFVFFLVSCVIFLPLFDCQESCLSACCCGQLWVCYISLERNVFVPVNKGNQGNISELQYPKMTGCKHEPVPLQSLLYRLEWTPVRCSIIVSACVLRLDCLLLAQGGERPSNQGF